MYLWCLALLLIKRAIALDMVRVTMTDYCRIGEHFLLDLRTRFSCLRIYHMTGMTKGWTQSLAKMPSITPSGLSPFLQYLSCNSAGFPPSYFPDSGVCVVYRIPYTLSKRSYS